jgi:hypothetical protein
MNDEPAKPETPSPSRAALALAIFGITLFLGFISLIFFLQQFEGYRYDTDLTQSIIIKHFPAVVGLLMAAGLSFLIVLLLPLAYGTA